MARSAHGDVGFAGCEASVRMRDSAVTMATAWGLRQPCISLSGAELSAGACGSEWSGGRWSRGAPDAVWESPLGSIRRFRSEISSVFGVVWPGLRLVC